MSRAIPLSVKADLPCSCCCLVGFTFLSVLFMAPVTPVLQWDPKPIMLTRQTAVIFTLNGILELRVSTLWSWAEVPSLLTSTGAMASWVVFFSSISAPFKDKTTRRTKVVGGYAELVCEESCVKSIETM